MKYSVGDLVIMIRTDLSHWTHPVFGPGPWLVVDVRRHEGSWDHLDIYTCEGVVSCKRKWFMNLTEAKRRAQ